METAYCDMDGEQELRCSIRYTLELPEGSVMGDFDGVDLLLSGPCADDVRGDTCRLYKSKSSLYYSPPWAGRLVRPLTGGSVVGIADGSSCSLRRPRPAEPGIRECGEAESGLRRSARRTEALRKWRNWQTRWT